MNETVINAVLPENLSLFWERKRREIAKDHGVDPSKITDQLMFVAVVQTWSRSERIPGNAA